MNPKVQASSNEDQQQDQNAINSITKEDLERYVSLFDLKRLESYSKNLVDFHLIMDLVPTLAKLYFAKQLIPRAAVNMSYTQSAILLGLGLQFKSVEDLQVDLNLQANQLLPLFNKGMRKFTRVFREVFERDIAKEIDEKKSASNLMIQEKMKKSMDEELNEGEVQLTKKMREEKTEFIKQFQKHQIKATEEDFDKALKGKTGNMPGSISVAQKKKR